MSLNLTSVLSVSQKEKLDCEQMARHLSNYSIQTSITSNISTQPHIEYGCRLTQPVNSKKDVQLLWSAIKRNYDFTCGHLKIDNIFDGCVLTYLNQKDCSELSVPKKNKPCGPTFHKHHRDDGFN